MMIGSIVMLRMVINLKGEEEKKVNRKVKGKGETFLRFQ